MGKSAAEAQAAPSIAHASAWSALEIVLRQAVQFGVTVILARLLTPEDFGAYALMTFFTGMSLIFVQGGLPVGLIQSVETSSRQQSAIFWFNLGASTVVGALYIVLASTIAAWFGYPALRWLLYVAAAQLVVSALGAVHMALLTRDMRFDLLGKAGVAASVCAGVSAVVAAWLGAGLWALALQVFILAFANTALLWLASEWRPRLQARWQDVTPFARFGSWFAFSNLMEVFYTNGFALLLGKLHGVGELGFYNRAAAGQLFPSAALSTIIARVSLPLLSARRDDPQAARAALRSAIGFAMMLNLPIMAGLAVLSPEIIEVLFGKPWLRAAPILSILAIGGLLLPMHAINVQFVISSGRSRTLIGNEVTKKGIGIACVIIGSIFGISGLAWGQVAYSVLGLGVNTLPARRSLGYGALAQTRDIAVPAAATLAMAGVLYFLKPFFGAAPLIVLAISIPIGAATYLTIGFTTGDRAFRGTLTELVGIVRHGGRLTGVKQA